ncbi:MAG: hypothetical protein DRO12_04980 [Thermoprotei archaeon]|nr:MAG: hypothetical protein DRO12_04980 [Thermoprotei archaeon]
MTHARGDVDAVASSIGMTFMLKALGAKNITILFPEGVTLEARKLISYVDIADANILFVKKQDTCYSRMLTDSTCIVLDTADSNQLRAVQDGISLCRYVVVVDHHAHGDMARRANLVLIDKNSSSTSELILELLRTLNGTLSYNSTVLECLLAGVLSDSRRFLHNVSPRTFELVSWALTKGAKYSKALELLRTEVPPSARIAKLKCLARACIMKIDTLYLCISHVGAYEADCANSLIALGCDAAFVFSEDKSAKAVRLVFRSNTEFLNKFGSVYESVIRSILKELGGSAGGHEQAGGALLKIRKVEEGVHVLISVLKKALGTELVPLKEHRVCGDNTW